MAPPALSALKANRVLPVPRVLMALRGLLVRKVNRVLLVQPVLKGLRGLLVRKANPARRVCPDYQVQMAQPARKACRAPTACRLMRFGSKWGIQGGRTSSW